MPIGLARLPESSGFPTRPDDSTRQLFAGDVDGIPLEDLPRVLGRLEELAARIRIRISLAGASAPAHADEDQEISVEEARRRFFPAYSKSGFYHARFPFKRQRAGRGTRITCSTAGIRRFLSEQNSPRSRTPSRTAVPSSWNQRAS